MHSSLSTTKAREQFADVLNEVAFKGRRVVLQRHGKAVAAMISAADLALLEELEDQLDLDAIRRAKAAGGPTIPWTDVKAELGLS